MIPYKWPVLTAVPQSLEKRLEIVQAIQALARQAEDERLRQQQAEIAARRRLIEQLEQTVHELWRSCDPRLRSRVLKYDPDQPRIPAGNPHGGEWTSEGGSGASSASSIASAGGAETSSVIQPATSTADSHVAQIPPLLFEEPPLVVRPPLPEFPKDPRLPPGPGFEWRGRPGSQPGDPEGGWYNQTGPETLRPDMDHRPPIQPHWDYKAPNGKWYRWFPDGRLEPRS